MKNIRPSLLKGSGFGQLNYFKEEFFFLNIQNEEIDKISFNET